VRIDPSQVDQLLANLTVNARDAIVGVGTVSVQTANVVLGDGDCSGHSGLAPGEYVRVTVGDDGCGIDAETQAHIFEPFFTTKEQGKGTGLGLATVYGIVTQNDGCINVISEPGRGTTFEIYLPRYAADVAGAAADVPRAPRGGTETVLLVEDEPALLDLGKAMLARLGYTVLAAGTPAEALRLAEDHRGPIHLLVTDVVMPQMNGRNLAARIMVLKPGLKCIYMSGYTADVIGQHGIVEDGVFFVQKPFTVQTLADRVREALDR
jgi:CheY-like chemotaxis protein